MLEGNDKSLGYTAVINELIINEENRLKRENQKLQAEKSQISQLQDQVNKLQSRERSKIEKMADYLNILEKRYEKLIIFQEKMVDPTADPKKVDAMMKELKLEVSSTGPSPLASYNNSFKSYLEGEEQQEQQKS